MIVCHVAVSTVEDYARRREPHRRAHIERLARLREVGIVVGGGPAPDGRSVDLVYRLQQPAQVRPVIEEDPYWVGGAWTGWTPRAFSHFVEPWAKLPIVLDGSRRATVVEGPVGDQAMAEFALIELRGAGRLHFGGFFADGATWALLDTADTEAAKAALADSGFWAPEALSARPLLLVL